MTARIPCCVPHCRRTAPLAKHPNATEVICAKHYRAVPLMWRRLHKRLQKGIIYLTPETG